MNYPYTVKFRRFLFWKSFKVIGHAWDEKQRKMQLFFEDGGIREIKNWDRCEVRLGADWVLATKRRQEDQIGQQIKLAVKE